MADDADSRTLPATRGLHDNLLTAIDSIERSRNFATFGSLLPVDLIDAGLSIEDIGPISLPLKSADARSLVALSQKKHAEKTCSQYHVPSARNFWSIDPHHIELGNGFVGLMKEAVKKAQYELKLAPDIA